MWAKAKLRVQSDSVLCLGRMHGHPEAKEKWKYQLQYFQQSNGYREIFGIVGEPTELEWNVFQGFTILQIFQKIAEKLDACQTSPEEFEDRIVFMTLFNDIDWTKNILNNVQGPELHKSFRLDIGHSSVQEKKKTGMERTLTNVKDRGIWLLMSWWKISKKVDIQYSEVSVR